MAEKSTTERTPQMPPTVLSPPENNRRLSFLDITTSGYLPKLWESMPADVYKSSEGMKYGEQSKYVTWEFPESLGTVELIQITDVQFGHIACKVQRVIEYRDWVLSVPNRFMLWTGDMVDAWAMWSPGTAFDQLADPQSQILKFCELWGPARHRILGYVGGNHERRAIPGFGDLGILMAVFLRIPYSNGKQMIDVIFGKHRPFKVSLWHGTGGARTKGAIAQNLDRFMGQGDSQVYLMGHLHQALIMPVWKEYRNTARQRMEIRKTIGAVGSSFMDTYGAYAEVKGFSVNDVLMPRTVLEADGHWEMTLK